MGLFSGSETWFYDYSVQNMLEAGTMSRREKLETKYVLPQSGVDEFLRQRFNVRKAMRKRLDAKEMTKLGIAPTVKMYTRELVSSALVDWLGSEYPLSDGRTYAEAEGLVDNLLPTHELTAKLYNDPLYDEVSEEYSANGKVYKIWKVDSSLSDDVVAVRTDDTVTMRYEYSSALMANDITYESGSVDREVNEKHWVIDAVLREDRYSTMLRDLLDNYSYDEANNTAVVDGVDCTDVDMTGTNTTDGLYITTCLDDGGSVVEIHTAPEEIDYGFTGEHIAVVDTGAIVNEYLPAVDYDVRLGSELYTEVRNSEGDGVVRYVENPLDTVADEVRYGIIHYRDNNDDWFAKIVPASEFPADVLVQSKMEEAITPVVHMKVDGKMIADDAAEWDYLTRFGVSPESMIEDLKNEDIKNAYVFTGINPTDETINEDPVRKRAIAKVLFEMFNMYDLGDVLVDTSLPAEIEPIQNNWIDIINELNKTAPNVQIDIKSTGVGYKFLGNKVIEDTGEYEMNESYSMELVQDEYTVKFLYDPSLSPTSEDSIYKYNGAISEPMNKRAADGGGLLVDYTVSKLVLRKRGDG